MTTSPSVLVIDDETAVAETICQVLHHAGYRAKCACNGSAAMQLLEDESFQVVITDVFMPDIDGIEVLMSARRTQPKAALIVMTGGGAYMTTRDALRVARALGATGCLDKPFTPAELFACFPV